MTFRNHDERVRALRAVEADLIWLTSPERPTCDTCEGEGGIGIHDQRRPCPRCDGIGTTEPTNNVSPMRRAREILEDRGFHAAHLRAQHPEGATTPTEGALGWSDPTGEAATRELGAQLVARDAWACWQEILLRVTTEVHTVTALTAAVLTGQTVEVRLDTVTAVARVGRLLQIPNQPLEAALRLWTPEDGSEVDKAIERAAAGATAVRAGKPSRNGRTYPSVTAVLQAERKVRQAEPERKPAAVRTCASHARIGVEVPTDRYHDACRTCGDWRSGNGAFPAADALRLAHERGKRLSWKLVAEAERIATRTMLDA